MDDSRTAGGEKIADGDETIGLALSGSGLRASLFHVGLLARLAELDLLRRVDVISATGGGALVGALYHLHLKRLLDAEGDIESGRLVQLVAALERDLLRTVQSDLKSQLFANPFANLKRISASYSSATRLGHLLDRQVFRPAWKDNAGMPVEMRDLMIQPRGDREFNPATDNRKRFCKAPVLIINATNLATGRPWRFDARRMGEPAASPALRRLSRAAVLGQSAYERLPNAHVRTPLGQAVAASMATPGLLEPLRLPCLYPDPEHRSVPMDVRLGDGRLSDPLGAEALLDHGCDRLILGEASGSETLGFGLADSLQARQLAHLESRRPGGVVLVQMLREVEALEVKPLGRIGRGRVITDRRGDDVTSYGVERRTQKLIAGMRAGLDAPSDVEALSLMASGYLVAKRAFQQYRQSGHAWTDDPPRPPSSWRFTPMIDPLRDPSKALIKHLKTASLPSFRPERLTMRQAFGSGILVVTSMLTLVALAASWSALRPEAGADRLWLLATLGLLLALAWLAGRHIRERDAHAFGPERKGMVWRMADKIGALLSAFPRAIAMRFQHRGSQAFLKAGRLDTVGIKLTAPEKKGEKTTSSEGQDAPETMDRAA
jgi:NTE family protein